jgi:hypothetical protein
VTLLLWAEIGASWTFAAATSSSGFDTTVYGVAGTTVAILLYFINRLWADNRSLRHDATEMANRSLERITAVATTASHQLAESTKSMEAATLMMHQIGHKPGLTQEQFYELSALLRELKGRG